MNSTSRRETPPGTRREPLAEAVISLAEASLGREHLTLGEILEAVGAQGPALAAALLSLPFLQPIPLIGLSTPIGAALAILGYELFKGRKVEIPQRIANVRMPVGIVLRTTEYLASFESKLKPYLKSDERFESPAIHRFFGGVIAFHGILLALPLPIPFSNTMPAWMCVFAALTILFASPRLFFASIAMLIVNICFWATLSVGAIWGSSSLVEWLGHKF
ncbi:exopolysaccharide biosynthesis protein [soil metagenome]